MWDVTGTIPDHVQDAIIAHLSSECGFAFQGLQFRLSAEELPFYGNARLCQLVLEPGCRLLRRGKPDKEIAATASFHFLFQVVDGSEMLLPLTGSRADIHLEQIQADRT